MSFLKTAVATAEMNSVKNRPLFLGLTAALAVTAALLSGVPFGVLVLGAVGGLMVAPVSLGIVMVYRSAGFLNLSQAAIALFCGALTARLVNSGISFSGSLGLSILAGMLLGALSLVVFGRFSGRPPLVLTAASLGLAYVIGAARAGVTFSGNVRTLEVPIDSSVKLFPVLFTGAHIVAVSLALIAIGFAMWFWHRTRAGLAARSLGDNPERAQCLGISSSALAPLWISAGLIAALGGSVSVAISGPVLQVGPGAFSLLIALLPAVIARMRSLAGTALVSIAVGIAYQAAIWFTDRAAFADVILVAILFVGLAADREAREALRRPLEIADLLEETRPQAVRLKSSFVVLSLAALAAVAVSQGSSNAQRIGTVAIFAIAGASVSVASRFTGTLSLGHWGIVGVACAAAAGAMRMGYLAAAVAGVAVGAITSLVAAAPARGRGPFPYAVSTLGLAVAAGGFLSTSRILQREAAAPPLLAGPQHANTLIVIASLGAVLLLLGLLRRSSLGTRMIAIRDSERVGLAFGIHPARVRAMAFAVSGAVAGLAGFLYLYNQKLVHPEAFGADRSLFLTAIVVAGGAGSTMAAALGAGLLAAASLFLTRVWELLGTGLGLLLILLLIPKGLAGIPEAFGNWLHIAKIRRKAGALSADVPPLAGDSLLGVHGVSCRFGPDVVLNNASLTVAPGEILVLAGANGSGKSTLLKVAAGLVEPSHGTVSLDGRDVTALRAAERNERGLVLVDGDRPVFPSLTVNENLRAASLKSHRSRRAFKDARESIMKLFPVLAARSTNRASDLSGGEQRMLALAQTLFARPKALLLDELALGLDKELTRTLHSVARTFARKGAGVVIVSHEVELVEGARVLRIERGVTGASVTAAQPQGSGS